MRNIREFIGQVTMGAGMATAFCVMFLPEARASATLTLIGAVFYFVALLIEAATNE